MHRVIGERDLDAAGVSVETALDMYRDMVLARRFDERALALQRRGWMSGYPPFRGQEATQVGAAYALAADDWLVPTYRQLALQIALGVPMSDLLCFRRGFGEYRSGHDLPVFTQAIPIGTQIPHATGVAMAADYREANHAVLCCFGDGATSEGDFHEGLNFAGVFEAPVVFLCENNGWAISMPRERQTVAPTIAAKAQAYGFPGIQVDGNDPLACREVVGEALERARDGEPTLIESLTYRQGPHTTSDEPERYQDAAPDVPDWRARDPVERYGAFLRDAGVLTREIEDEAHEVADDAVSEAVERAESIPLPGPDAVFKYVYEEMPPALIAQHGWLESFVEAVDVQQYEY